MLSLTFKYALMPVIPLVLISLQALALEAIVLRQQISALLIHGNKVVPRIWMS